LVRKQRSERWPRAATLTAQTRPCFMYKARRFLHAQLHSLCWCVSVRRVQKRKQKSEMQNTKTNARERETDIRKRKASPRSHGPVLCVLVSESSCHDCSHRERGEDRASDRERASESTAYDNDDCC